MEIMLQRHNSQYIYNQDIYNLRKQSSGFGEELEDIKDCMSWVYKYNARCFWGQNSYDQCDDFDLCGLKKSLGWKQKKGS